MLWLHRAQPSATLDKILTKLSEEIVERERSEGNAIPGLRREKFGLPHVKRAYL